KANEAQPESAGESQVLAQEAQEDPGALIDIPVKKEWIGAPASYLIVTLYKNDVFEKALILNSGNNWEGVFSNLPKFERVNDESDFPPFFEEIDYRVEEVVSSIY